MAAAMDWTGPVGSIWAQEWARTDRSFADLSRYLDAAVLDQLPDHARRAVDIGAGAGATSIALAKARPDLQVTGLDISPDLLAIARERGAGLANLSFITGAAEQSAVQLAPVDLFVSRHGVMFFADPVAAFSALRATAAPGARLVFSCFRSMNDNPWATALTAAVGDSPPPPSGYVPGPFAFAETAFVADILTQAGWTSMQPTAVDYRYRAGEGDDPVADALSFFKRIGPTSRLLFEADDAARPAMVERLRAILTAQRQGNAVDFPAAAWLWSAHAD